MNCVCGAVTCCVPEGSEFICPKPKDKEWGEKLWDKYCIQGSEANPTDTMYYEGFMAAIEEAQTTLAQAFFDAVPKKNISFDYHGESNESVYQDGWNAHEYATRSALKKVAEDYQLEIN